MACTHFTIKLDSADNRLVTFSFGGDHFIVNIKHISYFNYYCFFVRGKFMETYMCLSTWNSRKTILLLYLHFPALWISTVDISASAICH